MTEEILNIPSRLTLPNDKEAPYSVAVGDSYIHCWIDSVYIPDCLVTYSGYLNIRGEKLATASLPIHPDFLYDRVSPKIIHRSHGLALGYITLFAFICVSYEFEHYSSCVIGEVQIIYHPWCLFHGQTKCLTEIQVVPVNVDMGVLFDTFLCIMIELFEIKCVDDALAVIMDLISPLLF